MTTALTDPSFQYSWPSKDTTRVPFWIYSDANVYAREQQRIFSGQSWCYVGLAAEIQNPGDFKRSFVGDKSVVIVRDSEGDANVVVN